MKRWDYLGVIFANAVWSEILVTVVSSFCNCTLPETAVVCPPLETDDIYRQCTHPQSHA